MKAGIVTRLSVLALSLLFVISGPGVAPLESSEDSGNTVFTLTTESDFSNAETKWNVDTTSDPGNVSLTPNPTDWTKLSEEVSLAARMPGPRFYSPAIWDGDFAYIFGGEDGVPVNLDEILRYNPISRTSTVMDSVLPAAGGQMSVAWDGTFAYLFGGTTQGGGSKRDSILKYNPSTDTLTVMTEVLPSPRYSTAAVWTGSEALIFGGTDNSAVFDDILKYDPLRDEISNSSSRLPSARYDASAGWDGSNAFIFGGQRGSIFLDEILRYEPTNDTIALMSTRLPWGLAQASVVFDGESFYILGGQTSNGTIDSILKYDPSSDSIRVLDAILPTERHATGAVWTGSSALIFGGWPYPLDEIIEYTPGANPILTVGQPGSWDDYAYAVGSPSVIKDGSLYKMWYMGVSLSTRWHWKIGYSESSDGLTWTKRATPVFAADPASPWGHYGVARAQVLKVGNTYKMWYDGYRDATGTNNRIGHAESPNGIDWTRVSSTPVLDLGGPNEWDSRATWKVYVMFEDGRYRMWYTGHDGINCKSSIGYAESANGVNWTRSPSNPILGPQTNSWEGVGIEVSHVEKIGDQYIMWYNRHCPPEAVGVAVSPDGLNWTKYPTNPVLEKGDSDSWDNKGVTWVSVLRDSSAMKMWYSGDH
ncbi:MAG: Kelch repeat-containing protein, partial [Candidatus Thorarchaeota archaeon]